MKRNQHISIFTIAVILLTSLNTVAQQPLKLYTSNSKITIKGTSSVHDWEENVGKFNVQLILDHNKKDIIGVKKVIVTCQSSSITSDYALMTSKTHNALLADKHPEIVFSMVSVDDLKSADGKFSGILIGDLMLAGVARRIQFPFTGIIENDKLTITGSENIRMNDFNIKPPTAMLGTLKTGETVTVTFSLKFQVS